MNPALKRYYLMQMAYWIQQALIMVLGLEKPRSDYYKLIVHHIVTIWLVRLALHCSFNIIYFNLCCSWSYLMNMTLIGQAVYMSMDIPDAFLSVRDILKPTPATAHFL